MRFRFTQIAIDAEAARREVLDRGAGGYVNFEGWVRDHNEGREVTRLEYEAFQDLAVKEGGRIVTEALARFPIKHALCIHRVGSLGLADMAVWVGVTAAHRGEAFDACRFIIDEVKHRVPIWKKEHYRGGDSGWVNCEACAAAPRHSADHSQGHSQDHSQGESPGHSRGHSHDHGQVHGNGQDRSHAQRGQSHDRDDDRDQGNTPVYERSGLPASE